MSAIRSSAEPAPTPSATASWSSRRSTSPAPPGRPVQGHPGIDERAVAAVEQHEVVGPQHQVGVARPPQRLHVAQPAVAVLEVRLEQERDVAGLGPALQHPRPQRVQPPAPVTTPARQALRGQPAGQLLVAGQVAGAQQRRRRVEVVAGQRQLVVVRAHGMAELQAGVPQRVPQGRRRLLDALGLALVDEHHVDVAVRRQLTPAVAADGDERHRRLAPPRRDAVGSLGPQPDEQVVGRCREGPAQLAPAERRRRR